MRTAQIGHCDQAVHGSMAADQETGVVACTRSREPDHDVEHGVAVVFVEHVVQVASRFRWADAGWVVLPVGAWWWS
jgi:hypothetical protein